MKAVSASTLPSRIPFEVMKLVIPNTMLSAPISRSSWDATALLVGASHAARPASSTSTANRVNGSSAHRARSITPLLRA